MCAWNESLFRKKRLEPTPWPLFSHNSQLPKGNRIRLTDAPETRHFYRFPHQLFQDSKRKTLPSAGKKLVEFLIKWLCHVHFSHRCTISMVCVSVHPATTPCSICPKLQHQRHQISSWVHSFLHVDENALGAFASKTVRTSQKEKKWTTKIKEQI